MDLTLHNGNHDTTLSANGIEFEPGSISELRDSSDILGDEAAIRERMASEGYLLFRALLSRELVLEAREEILLKYAILGEIDAINHPLMEAIQGEQNYVDQVNLRAFSKSVRSGIAYERIVTHPEILRLVSGLLEDEVRPFDFRWPRFARPGEGCGFHYDGPYMSRGTAPERIFTTWIPLGDVSRVEGALVMLEGSHRNETLLRTYAQKDADRDKIPWLGTDPNHLRRRYGGQWLSTDFTAGDVLCFGMHMLHGALDNQSPIRRCRLTSDSRYQSVNEPFDERWNGDNPVAHGYDKVFYPGLGNWNNREFQDEWKKVDENGRLLLG